MGDDSELHKIQFLTFNFIGNFIGGFLAGGAIPAGAEHESEQSYVLPGSSY
jgi:formate/nitrite transporter FocA (FNT family)